MILKIYWRFFLEYSTSWIGVIVTKKSWEKTVKLGEVTEVTKDWIRLKNGVKKSFLLSKLFEALQKAFN